MTISRYKRRLWALYDDAGELICVCAYKKGAREVERRLLHQRKAGRYLFARTVPLCWHAETNNKHSAPCPCPNNDPVRPPWTPFVPTGQMVSNCVFDIPNGIVWRNSRYVVVVRQCRYNPTEAPLIWLSIKTVENDTRHDWREMQRIKNELVGPEIEAVELYPAESRLVDTSNQYHLWCFREFQFPFGFSQRLVSENTQNVKQRPFDPDVRPSDLTSITLQAELLPGEGNETVQATIQIPPPAETTPQTEGSKREFCIPCTWEMYGHLDIEAETLEAAVQKAYAWDTPLPTEAEFVEDSFRVDYEEAKRRAQEARPVQKGDNG